MLKNLESEVPRVGNIFLMKLKKKLLLKILAYVECHGNGESMPAREFADYNARETEYHIEICVQADLLHVQDVNPPYIGAIKGLTWEGHKALLSMRGEPFDWNPPK